MDPRKFRPRRDWIVVLADPREEKVGSILLPIETGVEKVTEGAGTLISVGKGEKTDKLGLEAGQRVMFRGFVKYAHRLETDNPQEHYFLMSVEDILAVIPEGVDVGVFSGRPQVPERK